MQIFRLFFLLQFHAIFRLCAISSILESNNFVHKLFSYKSTFGEHLFAPMTSAESENTQLLCACSFALALVLFRLSTATEYRCWSFHVFHVALMLNIYANGVMTQQVLQLSRRSRMLCFNKFHLRHILIHCIPATALIMPADVAEKRNFFDEFTKWAHEKCMYKCTYALNRCQNLDVM